MTTRKEKRDTQILKFLKENESNPKAVFMAASRFKLRTITIYNMFKSKVELPWFDRYLQNSEERDIKGVHPCLDLGLGFGGK